MVVLLLLTMAIPAAAAVLLMAFRRSMTGRTPRWIALAATVAALLVSIGLANEFRAAPARRARSRSGHVWTRLVSDPAAVPGPLPLV